MPHGLLELLTSAAAGITDTLTPAGATDVGVALSGDSDGKTASAVATKTQPIRFEDSGSIPAGAVINSVWALIQGLRAGSASGVTLNGVAIPFPATTETFIVVNVAAAFTALVRAKLFEVLSLVVTVNGGTQLGVTLNTIQLLVDWTHDIDEEIATDLDAGCLDWTTRIANLALSRIGISRQITDLEDEVTEDAVLVRLHYVADLQEVLRAFAWPFATTYATLDLVDGTPDTPVNDDWQYSYRLPTNHLFARRVLGSAGLKRAYDPNPPTFRLASDTNGGLLYTDQVDAVLEYTARLVCPASTGDAQFRSALAWKLAHSLAGPLTRDEKKIAYCWQLYQYAIVSAATGAAREQQQDKPGDADWISGRA
jgi:hypothetical protein